VLTGDAGLSRSEWISSVAAAVVSGGAYVTWGQPYLARGVVGDLTGFVLLGAAAVTSGRRVRHEAAVCLALIGVVLAADLSWPLKVPEPAWWGVFTAGIGAYVAVRHKVCRPHTRARRGSGDADPDPRPLHGLTP
jgi:hypothetical protein